MVQTIRDLIADYHATDKLAWNRPSKWFLVFQSIRKAYYAEEITMSDYKILMAELGVD